MWWNVDGETVKHYSIHNKHSSTIQALVYSNTHSCLYSGGADWYFTVYSSKIMIWDMDKLSFLSETKLDGRINSIIENPKDVHLFLATLTTILNLVLLLKIIS